MGPTSPADLDEEPGQYGRATGAEHRITGRDPAQPYFCDACFTGDYPISLPDQADNSERQLSLLDSH